MDENHDVPIVSQTPTAGRHDARRDRRIRAELRYGCKMDAATDLGILGVIGPIIFAILAFFWAFRWGGLRLLPGLG